MTDTSALRAFIEARLAEEQERAERGQWTAQFLSQGGRKDPGSRNAYARAIEREGGYSPARVLREVAAKRAILAARLDAEQEFDRIDDYEHQTACAITMGTLDDVLPLLASVWSDHPDYLTSWSMA
jgi:hypothetical protein